MAAYQETVARILLQIGAVHVSDGEPFVFTSGTVSPVYVDCRKLISFPQQRRQVVERARGLIERDLGEAGIEVVAGGETAGIPYAAWLAEALDLPMVYVRKQPKGFGRQAQIEGELAEDARVLLVEDLSFDAQSKINFCHALRRAGAVADHALVVFDYAIAASRHNLGRHGIRLHALCDWHALLKVGEAEGRFSPEQAAAIRSFLDDPGGWRPTHAV